MSEGDDVASAAAAARDAARNVKINRDTLRTNYFITLLGVVAVIVDLAVERQITIITLAAAGLTAVGVIGIVILKRQQTRIDDQLANPMLYVIFGVVALTPIAMGIVAAIAREWVLVAISAVTLAMVLWAWYALAQTNRHTPPTDRR